MALRALERLNPRERRLVTVLATALSCAAVLAIPFGLESIVHAREEDNQELSAALTGVQEARGLVRERQEKKAALLQRYATKAPALAGFLEQAAQHEKLEVTDSVDRPDVPHGKRYTEKSTTVHLKKAGLLPISKFLEALEKSGFPIEVSRLTLRKRMGEPDSYDVEVGVSAYDRIDAAPAVLPTPAASAPLGGSTLPGALTPSVPVAPRGALTPTAPVAPSAQPEKTP
jgi:general secretion pathway protein M